MKRIIILLMCVIWTTSCEQFLELESPDKLTSSTFWRDNADVQAALASTYAQLENSSSMWDFPEIKWPVEAFREDIIMFGSDALSYPNWMELYRFSYTNGNSQMTLYWDTNYRGASYANQVITKVGEMPDKSISTADRTLAIAEARFLRAYYHMKLQLNWEQIIIRDQYITGEDQLDKALSSRVESWDFICSELAAAAADLPATRTEEQKGRATSGAANAYLGWAYLTRAWEESAAKATHLTAALTALEKVQGYTLVNNMLSMFDGTNKNSNESIFELQFSENTANGASYRTAIHYFFAVSELGGWEEILPSKMLMDEYMKEGQIATDGRYDNRLYETIYFQCDYFNDPIAKRVYDKTYDEWFKDENDLAYNKPAFRRYLPPTAAGMGASRTGVNVMLMRYSNVLLMKAEVLNEMGRTPEAIALVDEVRQRANMPGMIGTTKEEVAAQIEHERILEFPLENFRFYDLRRWGKTKSALEAVGREFDPSKITFYPVPLTEIQSNEAL